MWRCIYYWLVVSTHLKNTSQIGNLPQIGVKIKNIWNHHLDYFPTNMCWSKPGSSSKSLPQFWYPQLRPHRSRKSSHQRTPKRAIFLLEGLQTPKNMGIGTLGLDAEQYSAGWLASSRQQLAGFYRRELWPPRLSQSLSARITIIPSKSPCLCKLLSFRTPKPNKITHLPCNLIVGRFILTILQTPTLDWHEQSNPDCFVGIYRHNGSLHPTITSSIPSPTLPETNSKRAGPQKETILFQPSIIRCYMWVSREGI